MSAISVSLLIVCAMVVISLNGEMVLARWMSSDQVPSLDRVLGERLYEHRIVQNKKAKRSLIQEEEDKKEQQRTIRNKPRSMKEKKKVDYKAQDDSNQQLAADSTVFSARVASDHVPTSNHGARRRSGRFRRTVSGYRMQCFPTWKKFCRMFTVSNVTKKFCIEVKSQYCTSLD